jgi:23S rRNA pseudouridine1911/1915/1917 synthase
LTATEYVLDTELPTGLHEVSAQIAGRLDHVLKHHFPSLSRSRLQKLIADGRVKIADTAVADSNHKIGFGQPISLDLPQAAPAEPQSENIPLDIIFEDKDLLVINKPAGLVVHPGAGNESGTLVNALLAHCGGSLSGIGGVKRPGIVHRLDKETSGLLVVAKNDLAHQGLSEQFASHGRDGRMEREYLAFVWGLPHRRAGTISTGLARSNTNRQKMAVSNAASSREAITHYEVVGSFRDPPVATLVRCRLETGRTHQIRVHMAHISHPVLGDTVYGSGFKSAEKNLESSARNALKQLNGQALHAAILGFEHPRTKRKLHFESALPLPLKRLYDGLASASATELTP